MKTNIARDSSHLPTGEMSGGEKEIQEKKHPWRKEWEERKAFYGHER